MDVRVLIETGTKGPDLPHLAKTLDELGHEGRVWAVRAWNRPLQAKLFEAVQGFKKIGLDDFVPAAQPPHAEIVHEGKNSLPLHSHFKKRFCRPLNGGEGAGDHDKLWGYNDQSFAVFTGPGYFTTRAAETEGEIEFDYTLLPKDKPDKWPAIVPNTVRLGSLVFAGMIDIV